jgi:hypothetical protein
LADDFTELDMQYGVKSRTIWRESVIALLLGSPTLFVGIWMWQAGLPWFIVLYTLFCLVVFAYWLVAASFRVRVTGSRVERVLLGRFVVRTYPVTQFEHVAHDHLVFAGGRTLSLLGVEPQDVNQIATLLDARRQQALAAPECFDAPLTVRIDPAWRAWNGGVVVHLAQRFAREQEFDHLTVLADALEEAGCADRAILDHLRSPSAHVSSCWVIALCLGES